MDNVDKDLGYLRKKINHEVRKAENVVIHLITEQKIKVDNLDLKLVKPKAPPKQGSSTSLDAKFN